MDRGTCQATGIRGITKSQTTEQVSTHHTSVCITLHSNSFIKKQTNKNLLMEYRQKHLGQSLEVFIFNAKHRALCL